MGSPKGLAPLRSASRGDGGEDSYLFTLSARSSKALEQLAGRYVEYLQAHPDILIEDIFHTVNLGRSHFNYRLAASVISPADLQTKLTQYLASETTADLWQGKTNLNQETKLALIFKPENQELQELITSTINSPIVELDVADIYWKLAEEEQTLNSNQAKVIYSPIKHPGNHRQILIKGLAQLYTLGVNINWQTLEKNSGGKKISLPTYPFQRATYWLE
jgi:3-oxoacyl-[acyl-carrier-protein] synthase II